MRNKVSSAEWILALNDECPEASVVNGRFERVMDEKDPSHEFFKSVASGP